MWASLQIMEKEVIVDDKEIKRHSQHLSMLECLHHAVLLYPKEQLANYTEILIK
jgi:hypothetical protein